MFSCVPVVHRIVRTSRRMHERIDARRASARVIHAALAAALLLAGPAAAQGPREAVASPFVLRGAIGGGASDPSGANLDPSGANLGPSGANLLDTARALGRATRVHAPRPAPRSGPRSISRAPAPADDLVTGSVGEGEPFREWFRYGGEIEQDWRVSGVADDPFSVRIAPRTATAPGSATKRPRVFVLYPRLSSAYDTSITQILSVFAEKGIAADITVMNFQRDGARAQAALDEAVRLNSDLIFAMGSESTAWLWRNFRNGSIPVVSVCSKDPVMLGQAEGYDRGSDTNFAFTSLNMPVEAQLAYVFGLKPDLKNLAILVDANNVSAVQTQSRPIARMARHRGVRVVELALEDRANAREELAGMVGAAVKSMRLNDPGLDNSIFWITGSTAVFREIATINEHANRVPVLSVVPEVVQPGDDSAALSVGISFKSNAHLAALYGSKVLSGRVAVGTLKVGVPSPPDIAINFKRVREIGLRMPFSFFEGASTVIDYEGVAVRHLGKKVKPSG